MKVKKAVIPAAGLGTRFLPATKAVPKEMLPIVDRPAIDYVVEEAVESGIEDILILTNRSKSAIEDYYDYHPELEKKLRDSGREEDAEMIRRIADRVTVSFLRQKETLGLGHAVFCARRFVGDEPFAVLLGDDIMKGEKPVTRQLAEAAEKYGCSTVGARHVPLDQIGKYCSLRCDSVPGEEKVFRLLEAIEKPRPDQILSDFAILGRYVFTPDIFDVLADQEPGYGGEIQLTDAIARLAKRETVMAVDFEGKRYDTGNVTGYLETVLEYALCSPKSATWLREYIDLGDMRTGVAVSEGTLASGLCLIEEPGLRKTARRIADIALSEKADTVVIGDPLNMDGSAGEKSDRAHALGKLLKGQLFARGLENVRIVYQDERLTTVEAHGILHQTGNRAAGHREKVDVLSAELILERFLDSEATHEDS